MMRNIKRLKPFALTVLGTLTLAFALPSAAQSININSASAEELEELPGIGAKTAEKIVNDREENGRFMSVEDLSRVPGVTSGTIAKIDGMATTGRSYGGSNNSNQKISRKKIKQAMQIFAREPSVREVQAAALDQSRARPEVLDGWLARQRLAGLMPRLTARFDYVFEDDTALRSGGSPSETKEDDNRYNVRAEARWETHWLMFRNDELRSAREGVRLAGLRDRVLNEVTRRFFERRRLLLDLELAPPTDLQDAVRKELRVQEITADLDTLTGGWFSKALEKSGQKPY